VTGNEDTTGMEVIEGQAIRQGSSNLEGEVTSKDTTCVGDLGLADEDNKQ